MAAQVIGEMTGLWAKNRETNQTTGLIDYIGHFLNGVIEVNTGKKYKDKVDIINETNAIHDAVQAGIDTYRQAGSQGFKMLGIDVPEKLASNTTELYDIVAQAVKGKEGGEDYLNALFPLNKFNSRDKDNATAFDKLQNFFRKVPFLQDPTKSFLDGGKGGKGVNASLIDPNDKITGQRVITYNITIREMNGLKDVKVDGMINTPANLKLIGDEVEKVMLDIINDTQLKVR
jgi:hypothetical protein